MRYVVTPRIRSLLLLVGSPVAPTVITYHSRLYATIVFCHCLKTVQNQFMHACSYECRWMMWSASFDNPNVIDNPNEEGVIYQRWDWKRYYINVLNDEIDRDIISMFKENGECVCEGGLSSSDFNTFGPIESSNLLFQPSTLMWGAKTHFRNIS